MLKLREGFTSTFACHLGNWKATSWCSCNRCCDGSPGGIRGIISICSRNHFFGAGRLPFFYSCFPVLNELPWQPTPDDFQVVFIKLSWGFCCPSLLLVLNVSDFFFCDRREKERCLAYLSVLIWAAVLWFASSVSVLILLMDPLMIHAYLLERFWFRFIKWERIT